MGKPKTLGELRTIGLYTEAEFRTRTVKDEMRGNLIGKLQRGERLFEGIVGYDETVVPQIVNAVLSKHNMILLGLRGQAKSRILRGLTTLLDEEIPVVAGCEINDNPFAPLCRACRVKVKDAGDETPIAFLPREARYVEKLATPDVTIADIIGDVDPIKAARGGLQLSDELTIHYGLLPRANRALFAINELPDLASKIQVGLFNILQEGDVQIKGYPIRLPLDVVLIFTANPEDYTARGKIITPLKDRIGSEVRTHYPATVEDGMAITEQEAWLRRQTDGQPARDLNVPRFIREVIEEVAFQARKDQRVDKRSGVSQRLPITCLENVVSNAERRAILCREPKVVPRVSDIYASLPAITGKIELEYEGEQRGAENLAKDLIRASVGEVFARRANHFDPQAIVQWFDHGGAVKVTDTMPARDVFSELKKVPGLMAAVNQLGVSPKDDPNLVVSLAEFILEGLYAQKRISRSEERGYQRAEKRPTWSESGIDDWPRQRRRLN
jgi:magnesium chelatase subunit I